MSVVISTNTASLEAQQNLGRSRSALMRSFAKLSSGYRINSAADDAAGLAISESMKAQIRSYVVAERNANDAISMVQTAEGSLGEIHGILGRMRELAMQSANGSMTSTDRSYIDTEFQQLKAEISRIQGNARFNGVKLLSTTGAAITFQVGINDTAADKISVTFGGLALTTLLAASTVLSGATQGNALTAIGRIDSAFQVVASQRADYGAAMNRLEVTASAIQTMRTNLSAANSRIRDVDVAEETATLARNQVLAQAGTAVVAQANQLPQMAMDLIRG